MKKTIILLLLILVSICAISHASAVDDASFDNLTDTENEIIEETADEPAIAEDANDETIASDEWEYRELQWIIDNTPEGGSITLNKSSYGCDYLINVTKSITIDGNGTTITFTGNKDNVSSPFFVINKTATNVVLKNIKFSKTTFLFGGAITWLGDNGAIINCTFVDNSAEGEKGIGGALLIMANNCNVTNSTFKHNIASLHGGAILWNGTGGRLTNCEFIDNHAEEYGGALVLLSDNFLVENCNFTNNYCQNYGGAIAVLNNNNTIIRKCKFEHNSVLTDDPLQENVGGGAIFSACYGVAIDNCSFVQNHADKAVAGAISLSDNDTVTNSFFNQNYAFNTTEPGYLFTNGNDIVYYGNSSAYNDNIILNTFILDYGETEQNAVANNFDDVLERIFATNTFTKTKINSSVEFSTGIIFEYGATSSPIQITVVGGTIGLDYIKVLNHPEAKITLSNRNSLTVSGLSVGKYVLQVTTIPDENHIAVTGNLSITVNKATAVIQAQKVTVAYKKGAAWSITLVNSRTKKPIANMVLTLKVYTGSKFKTVTVKTNSKGVASYQTKSLSTGNHKVIVSATHAQYKFNTLASSIKVVKQTPLKFTVKKKTLKDGASLSITVKVKKTKKAINGVKVKLLIYTGKKYKTVTLKSKKIGKYKGVCGFATNKLSVGKHNVKIMPVDIKYSGSANSNMKITKKAKKAPDWETKQ